MKRLLAPLFLWVFIQFIPNVSFSSNLNLLVDAKDKAYQIYAPAGWVKETPKSKSLHATVKKTSPYCSVGTVVLDNYPNTKIDIKTLDTFINSTQAKFKNMKITSKMVESFQGNPSGWYEFTAEVPGYAGVLIRQRHYIIIHGGRFYGIIVTAPNNTWSQSVPEWTQIINNWKFTSGSSSNGAGTSSTTKTKFDF